MKKSIFKFWESLPDRIRLPLDIVRRVAYWKRAGVIFIHVPKAAGVTVSRAIYGRPLGHFTACDIRRIMPGTFSSLLTFGVVRHPLQRLVSAYRFAKVGGTGEMGMKNPSSYFVSEFRTFDSFVSEWLVHQDLFSVDGVFKPQHLYLCEGDNVIVDHVIYLEKLEEGIRLVGEKIGRVIYLGHHNRTSSERVASMSPETIGLVQQLYEKDYKIFGYPLQ